MKIFTSPPVFDMISLTMSGSPTLDASSAGEGDSVFDHAAALRNVEGDAGLLRELAEVFLRDYPAQMDEIRDAVSRHDAGALAQCAHGVKGSVANFAARQAVELARSLELMGREGHLDQAPEACAALEAALGKLQPFLAGLVE